MVLVFVLEDAALLMCLKKHLLDLIYGCDVFSPALKHKAFETRHKQNGFSKVLNK